jgi:hypothetical protein
VSTVPTIALTVAGVLLIAAALRDVFDSLFHETGRAVMSEQVMRVVWQAFRRITGRKRLSFAGPFSLVAVVTIWATLLVVGWALIVMPHLPDGYAFTTGEHAGRLVDSLYVSLVTLTTVGFGDITPTEAWLRLITPLEALIGFGLLTASVSWLLSIYPLLSRRRALAYEIHLLTEAETRTGRPIVEMESAAAETVYSDLTSRLVAVERDLVTFPVAYYFAENDDRFSLPAAMPVLLRLARAGSSEGRSDPVRLRATMLLEAIDDFARTAADRFHGSSAESTDQLLVDYARDHLVLSDGARS